MILVTGFPRSGTTLMYCMLRYAVDGYQFLMTEKSSPKEGTIIKSPRAVFDLAPKCQDRCIVMIRDPRYILTSIHGSERFKKKGYFVSAHSCVNYAKHGLCEWWQAISKLSDACLIRYEDLLARPRKIQKMLGERFGFKYREGRFFDEFHLEDHGGYWESAMNGRRPIGKREQLDKERLREQFTAFPELHEIVAEMGYA